MKSFDGEEFIEAMNLSTQVRPTTVGFLTQTSTTTNKKTSQHEYESRHSSITRPPETNKASVLSCSSLSCLSLS
jgi:hypothetical protein